MFHIVFFLNTYFYISRFVVHSSRTFYDFTLPLYLIRENKNEKRDILNQVNKNQKRVLRFAGGATITPLGEISTAWWKIKHTIKPGKAEVYYYLNAIIYYTNFYSGVTFNSIEVDDFDVITYQI